MAIIKLTPQQITDQTSQQTAQTQTQQQAINLSQVNPSTLESNIPPNLKVQGADKLALVLNRKRNEIKDIFIPALTKIAAQTGIQNIGTPNVILPDTCLSQDEINKLISSRNQLINRLNNIVKITDTLSKSLIGLNLVTTTLSTLIGTLKNARKLISVGVKFIPSPPGAPGAVVSALNDLKDVEENISLDKDSVNKIDKISKTISAISISISLLNATLLSIISMFKSIDQYFNKCSSSLLNSSSNLTPLSDTLLELERINNEVQQNANELSYNGFILEIVEEPYSPTVNRRRAVAKNAQGIILLQTPLSFTTEDLILIEELKLLIDTNNLKAN